MKNKMQDVQETLIKLRGIAQKSLKCKKYKKAISAISACAQIEYEWNQTYKDDELEECLSKLSKKLIKPKYSETTKKVLFYDGFGLDIRGLAIIYLKSLAELGYEIVYITSNAAEKGQSEIKRVLKEYNVQWVYYDTRNYLKQMECMINSFEIYRPQIAFYYTTPYDAVAAVVFEGYANRTERYLINLTDHAFWIGLNSFDYCIEFRTYGASISNKCRGIEKAKLFVLPYYPYIREEITFKGLPFDEKQEKFVFSGGSLYKTFGDTNATYYKILDRVLEKTKNISFLYVGSGNTSELEKIRAKYPNKVYIMAEREDFFEIVKRCALYLNTYPIAGGLMTQYAAMAGKIPITLLPADGMFDEILFEQEKRKIEYSDEKVLVEDILKLLEDEAYRKEREWLLKESVISEKEFNIQLQNIIKNKRSKYKTDIREVNDKKFKEQYMFRFDLKLIIRRCIAEKRKASLLFNFPIYFLNQIIYVIKGR